MTYECALDGGAYVPCTSPWEVPVDDGEHVVSIRSIDAAGNRDATPIVRTWTVDSSTPDTVVEAAPSGTVGPTGEIEFTSPDAAAGNTFECSLDGSPYAACTSPYDVAGLASGAHVFQVRVVSRSGNRDASPATRIWTVDATAPTLSITDAPASTTDDATPVIGFSAEPDATVTCAIPGVADAAPCTSPYTGPRLAPGDYTFVLHAVDAFGNASETTTAWTVTPKLRCPVGQSPIGVTAVDAAAGHACALLTDGTVKCWGGYTFDGQLGNDDTATRGLAPDEMGNALRAVDLGTGHTATALAGYYHSCAILEDGGVKCWGASTFGELGVPGSESRGAAPGELGDNLPEVDLGTGRTAIAIRAGVWTTCAILDDHQAKCWGANFGGWLGQGDTSARGQGATDMGDNLHAIDLGTGRSVLDIQFDNSQACALLDDHTVKCWGQNGSGQLGLGDTEQRGDAPGEMGDALPTVDLGTGRTATAIAVGVRHACAILDDGSVKCWGENSSGQLGLGDTGTRGDAPGEMGDALPRVALPTGRTAVTIAAGYFQTCAILDDGALVCWGENDNGSTGQPASEGNHGDQPGEMGDNLRAVDLGAGRTVVQVDIGQLYACAVLDDASLKCWGTNGSQGALGTGDQDHRGDQAGEMGDTLAPVDLGCQ